MKIRRRRNPITPDEEEGLREDDAADLIILPRWRCASISLDPAAHLLERGGAILLFECVPRDTRLEKGGMREEASTHNEVFRMMKFEQERLADGQRLKEPLPAGLPKVHLFKVPNLAEEAEPITVGHCDPGVHDALNLLISP